MGASRIARLTHAALARATALSAAIVLGVFGCSAPAGSADRPAWVDGRFDALDESEELLGVGSATGLGPDAAETARQRALAAVLQQLSAQVRSETTSRDRETLEQSATGGAAARQSATASTDRERTITVSSAAQLQGARFELASGRQDGADRTWALARVDRAGLVAGLAAEVRAGLDAARDQLDTATSALASVAHEPAGHDTAPAGAAASPDVARGAVAALAAQAALDVPRERLPLLPAAAGGPTPVQRELAAELSVLSDRTRALVVEVSRRLDLGLAGESPRLRLSGQLDTLVLRARWDGAPLPGLPVAARLGDGAAVHALTDARGLVSLRLPQANGAGPLRAGIALDGQPGPLLATLPVSVPAAASARVAVVTRHDRDDGPGAPAPIAHGPSALQAPLEQALGAMHFLVVATDGATAAPADYRLEVITRSSFRSREGRQQQGVVWYGTSLQARFVDTASGDAFSVAVRDTDSRDAGINAEQAEQRSLARALARLLDEQRPDALPTLLRARFR